MARAVADAVRRGKRGESAAAVRVDTARTARRRDWERARAMMPSTSGTGRRGSGRVQVRAAKGKTNGWESEGEGGGLGGVGLEAEERGDYEGEGPRWTRGSGEGDDGGGQAEEGDVPVQGAKREPAVDAGLAGLPEAEEQEDGGEEENGGNETGGDLTGEEFADEGAEQPGEGVAAPDSGRGAVGGGDEAAGGDGEEGGDGEDHLRRAGSQPGMAADCWIQAVSCASSRGAFS